MEQYLDQCLTSVQAQTFADWECILVDDGSSDRSGEICDHWAKHDTRFKAIHQANAGVSAARNRGIELAQGEKITFIDSDDWVDADYLQNMIDAPQADLVVSGYTQHFNNGDCKTNAPIHDAHFCLDNNAEELFKDLTEKYLLYSPYIKLFDIQIVRCMENLFPIHLAYGEDLEFCFTYLHHARTVSCVAASRYHYRKTDSGTLSGKVRPDQFVTDYRQWRIVRDFFVEREFNSAPSLRMLYARLWGLIYDALFLCRKLPYVPDEFYNEVLSIPEISELRKWQDAFSCSRWIKTAILHRWAWVFKLYFAHQ